MHSRAEGEFAKTKRNLWEYYTGKSDASVYAEKPFDLKILKQDVDKYIEADEAYIQAKQKMDYLSTVVDFLDRTIKQIGGRDWTIRNAIEWRKFTSGAI